MCIPWRLRNGEQIAGCMHTLHSRVGSLWGIDSSLTLITIMVRASSGPGMWLAFKALRRRPCFLRVPRKGGRDRLRMAGEGGSGLAIDEIYVNLTIGRDFFGGQGHTSPGLFDFETQNPT